LLQGAAILAQNSQISLQSFDRRVVDPPGESLRNIHQRDAVNDP
jgi:hypothetical protein